MGKDNIKTYLHVAVAKSYDGRVGFKTDEQASDRLGNYPFIGFATDYSEEDPVKPEYYVWSIHNKELLTVSEFEEAEKELGYAGHGDPVGQPGTEYPGFKGNSGMLGDM